MNQPAATAIPPHPDYSVDWELLALASGHFLFRAHDKGEVTAKFVTITDAAAAFTGADVDTGWMPAGIVRAGYCRRGPYAVFTAPLQSVAVTIMSGTEKQQLVIPIPATVMVGVSTTYYIGALAGEFSPKERLMRAPFPNVYEDTHICWGTDNRPKPAKPGNMPAMWSLFFDAPFTGELVNGKSKKHPDDVREALRAVGGKKKYPVADLVSNSRTVQSWLKNILGEETDDDDN